MAMQSFLSHALGRRHLQGNIEVVLNCYTHEAILDIIRFKYCCVRQSIAIDSQQK
jgi:hypothetical protein